MQWAEQAKTLNLFETLPEEKLYQMVSHQPEDFNKYMGKQPFLVQAST